MSALALLFALIGFMALALATDEHHQRRLALRPSPIFKRRLRRCGWAAILAGLPTACAAAGLVFGPILWAGVAMLAAGVTFLLLNLLPNARRPARRTQP
jgi:hypothetical protein